MSLEDKLLPAVVDCIERNKSDLRRDKFYIYEVSFCISGPDDSLTISESTLFYRSISIMD